MMRAPKIDSLRRITFRSDVSERAIRDNDETGMKFLTKEAGRASCSDRVSSAEISRDNRTPLATGHGVALGDSAASERGSATRARDYLPLIRSFDPLLAAEAYGQRRVASRMHARTRVCRVIVINVVVISVISVISGTIPRAALCPSRLIFPRKYQTQRNCVRLMRPGEVSSESSMHVFHDASETVSPSSAGHVSRKHVR